MDDVDQGADVVDGGLREYSVPQVEDMARPPAACARMRRAWLAISSCPASRTTGSRLP